MSPPLLQLAHPLTLALNGGKGISWQWWGGDTKDGPWWQLHTHTCLHVHMHKHTHACVHAHRHTHTLTDTWERMTNKNRELSLVEHLAQWGWLQLFVSWVGDWLDSDNETNYVKSSVCSKMGFRILRVCAHARVHLCIGVFSDRKLAGGDESCEGKQPSN